MADELTALVSAVATDDDEVRARVRRLLFQVLDEAEEIIREGASPVKMGLMRSMLPHIARMAARKDDESEELALLRQEMESLKSEVRGSVDAPDDAE